MYKKLSVLATFIVAIISANANTIRIKVTDSIPSTETKLILKYFVDGNLLVKDSVLINSLNKNQIEFNTGNYFGYAELVLNSAKNAIGFIINPSETKMEISFNMDEFKNDIISVQNSRDNLIYSSLLEYKKKFDKTIGEIRFKRDMQNRFDSLYLNKLLQHENLIEKNYNLMNVICDSVLKYDTTFYTSIIADFLKTPTGTYFPSLRKDFDNYDALLHWHYFDFIDFSNPLILNHPALIIKIKDYFSWYTFNNNFSQQEGIDVIMKKAENNPVVRNFLFNYLLEYFLNLNLDEAVKYIYEKYADGCGLQLSSQKLKEISGIIYTNINSKIPDIVSTDSKGEIRSLLVESAKNKYTLVYVWTSWCHACQTKTPKIVEISNPFLKKGLGVFSISLDDKKDNWLSAILKYKIESWTNTSELVPIQNSNTIVKLNIRTTPKIYIIDKNGIIIAKNIYGEDLQKKLVELFK